MPHIDTELPQELFQELSNYLKLQPGQTQQQVLSQALKMYLHAKAEHLFQISTATALVAGIYGRALSVGDLLQYGNLGLGTFENLDGEMIVADGVAYQARADGSVERASHEQMTPFAVVSQFITTRKLTNVDCTSMEDLEQSLDSLRNSDNQFCALRITGEFDSLHLRAVGKTQPGVRLVQAAAVQAEFHLEKTSRVLVGFWSPLWAKTLNVPGYHLHFISRDESKGGHLLDLSGKDLCLEISCKTGFTTLLPQDAHFNQADLNKDPSDELAKAERIKKQETAN